MKIKLEPQEIEAITKALEHPKYEWRTIAGAAKDSHVPIERVAAYLLTDPDGIVRSSVPSKDGEDLFTTRTHFAQKASSVRRISSAFKNRLA